MKVSLTEQEARRLVDEISMAYHFARLEDRIPLQALNRLSNELILQLVPWMERSISSDGT